jgi:sec-independent protein translocase protein TatA
MNPFSPIFAIGPFGPTELIIILFIVLLLFGAKKLPDLARGLGKSVSEFKKGTSEAEKEIKDALDSEPKASEKKSETAKSSHGSN